MSLGPTGLYHPLRESHNHDAEQIVLIKPNELDVEGANCARKDASGIAICHKYQPLVMMVGGAQDPKYKNVLKFIFTVYNKDFEAAQDIGYGTFQTGESIKALALHWLSKEQKVVLIGHSYGGDTVVDVARELSRSEKSVELLVTLDPVSRFGPRASQPKPTTVKRWLNVYVPYDKIHVNKMPNIIAKLGSPWKFCKNADKNYEYMDNRVSGYEHAYANEMFKFVRSEVESVR